MARSARRKPRPGDRVGVVFGTRKVKGTVTSVRGSYAHVSVELDGSDEPVDRFVPAKDLTPA